MNKDIKYILKRVIIGVLVGVILFSIKSCKVNASTLVTPDAYFKINNIESFPASLDNYATYNIEYAYPAGGIEYNYLILETCTQGSYNEFYIYSDACNYSCFEPGTITSYKAGSCTTNNSAGSKVIFQIRVKKAQLMADTLYNRVNNRIRFVGAGKTEIYSFFGSDTDVITQLSTMQQNTQNIINQITSGFSNSSAKQDAIKDSVDDLNDTMQDDTIDNSESNSFFNNFQDNTHGLSGIITAPLSVIQSLVNVSPTSCQDLSIQYHNKTIKLPCGSIFWGHEGFSSLNDFYNLVVGGMFSYLIIRNLFLMIEKLKDPDNDKVEVIDL